MESLKTAIKLILGIFAAVLVAKIYHECHRSQDNERESEDEISNPVVWDESEQDWETEATDEEETQDNERESEDEILNPVVLDESEQDWETEATDEEDNDLEEVKKIKELKKKKKSKKKKKKKRLRFLVFRREQQEVLCGSCAKIFKAKTSHSKTIRKKIYSRRFLYAVYRCRKCVMYSRPIKVRRHEVTRNTFSLRCYFVNHPDNLNVGRTRATRFVRILFEKIDLEQRYEFVAYE